MRVVATAFAAGFALIAARGSANAGPDDWRVCIASDFSTRTAYITEPFESTAESKDVETEIGKLLDQKNLTYQNVQCRVPTDLIQSETERDQTIAFVKALGFDAQPLE